MIYNFFYTSGLHLKTASRNIIYSGSGIFLSSNKLKALPARSLFLLFSYTVIIHYPVKRSYSTQKTSC